MNRPSYPPFLLPVRPKPKTLSGWSWLLLGLAACGGGTESPLSTSAEAEPPVIHGTLLAGVELPAEHRVEFYEFSPGQIGIRELGRQDDRSRALTVEQLQGMSLEEAYRKLVPDAEDVPAELLAAEVRRQTRRQNEQAHALTAPPEAVMPAGPVQEERAVMDAASDAAWFRSTFCTYANVDFVYCATDIANAQSGWRRTTYFESTSANMSYSAPATMWLNVWNCDGGCSWKRIGTYTLNPRYWGSWGLEGTAWYHAGVDSSVPQVEYALRYRDAFPQGFHQTSEYPFDGAYDYTERIQGIAHSPNGYWYVTQEWAAYKLPVGSPLGASGQATAATGIPAPLGAYHHMGDADFYNGRLYVPMEGSTPAIAVFDSNLNYLTHTFIPGAVDAPWCAINPVDGLLYVSSFSNVSQVRKFRMQWINGFLYLSQEGAVDLKDAHGNPITLDRIQGGAFSPKGHLYLVMDVAGHGVKGFEVRSGRQYANIPVNFDPSWDTQEELEGIDIWDLDNGAAPGVNGQIHVLMLDNDLGDDELFFKHYSVTNAGEKGNL
jgi:hypothetical protein